MDDTVNLATRVAALLVLLYGARANRIHKLTSADVTTVGSRTYLALSADPIEVSAPVAQLLVRLAMGAERDPRALRRDGESSYLFVSPRRRHEPIHPTTRRWLARAGVSPRIARNFAMLALTSDFPPPSWPHKWASRRRWPADGRSSHSATARNTLLHEQACSRADEFQLTLKQREDVTRGIAAGADPVTFVMPQG